MEDLDKSYAISNTKGSVGKTPISLSLAFDLGLNIQTNDLSALLLCYKENTKLVNTLEWEKGVVYDMGGFVAEKVIDIVSQVEKVVVPVNDDPSAIIHTISCLKQFIGITKNPIIILITKTESNAEYLKVKKTIDKKFPDNNFKYFELPSTKAFKHSLKYGKSIKYLVENSKRQNNWFGDYVKNYYEPILEEIKK
jgi:MinD-like ATPase involved in chromosome partitioning or flagellar assembly